MSQRQAKAVRLSLDTHLRVRALLGTQPYVNYTIGRIVDELVCFALDSYEQYARAVILDTSVATAPKHTTMQQLHEHAKSVVRVPLRKGPKPKAAVEEQPYSDDEPYDYD